jgi:hypothetical protein
VRDIEGIEIYHNWIRFGFELTDKMEEWRKLESEKIKEVDPDMKFIMTGKT